MRRGHGSSARKARTATFMFILLAAVAVLVLVAYRADIGSSELVGQVVHMWSTFFVWLALGVGCRLA